MELTPGLMLSFADAQNTELPGVVVEVGEADVVVDFNHPLSGRDITCDVEIISVIPANAHAVEIK
jgi:FKBP-type peptidyl-prolyl cis-trans isomerase SlpA